MSSNSMPQSSTVSGRPANAGGFFRNTSVENLTLTRFPDTSTGRKEGSLAIINPHIKEVQTIISQVDKEFRSRREKCKRLEWEISDLENQLHEVEHTTQEYSTLAASEGAALSWARNLFNSLDTAMKEIYDQDIPPLQTVHQAMTLFLGQGVTIRNAFQQHMDIIESKACTICDSINASSSHLLAFRVKISELLDIVERSQAESSLLQADSNLASNEEDQARNELFDFKQDLMIVDESVLLCQEDVDIQRLLLQRSQQCTEKMEQDLQDADIQIEYAYLNVERLTSQYLEDISDRNDRLESLGTSLKLVQKSFGDIRAKAVGIGRMIDQLSQTEALHAQAICSTANDLCDLLLKIEILQFQHSDVECYLWNMGSKLTRLRSEVKTAVEDHEKHYTATCNKLKELKLLQEIDSFSRRDLQQAKMVLKKKKDEMEATTNQVNEETVTLMQERDWQQNELERSETEHHHVLELESMFAEDVSSHAIEGELIREELIRCKEAKIRLVNRLEKIQQKNAAIVTLDDMIQDLHCKKNYTDEILITAKAKENTLRQSIQELDKALEKHYMTVTDEEEEALQRDFEHEASKLLTEANLKYQQEVNEIEACREKIRNALINNPRILELNKEIGKLENELLLARNSNPHSSSSMDEDENDSASLPSVSTFQSFGASHNIERNFTLAFSARKDKKHQSEQDMTSKVSMNDLFREEF